MFCYLKNNLFHREHCMAYNIKYIPSAEIYALQPIKSAFPASTASASFLSSVLMIVYLSFCSHIFVLPSLLIASLSISSMSIGKSRPASLAIFGRRLVSVIPGMVFTSEGHKGFPLLPIIRSTLVLSRCSPELYEKRATSFAFL